MAVAQGTNKSIAVKKETTWGTMAGASGAKYLRRKTAEFNLTKDTYESAEIRTDKQIAVKEHGIRKVSGTIAAELSPGSYSDFLGSIVGQAFSAGASTSSANLTIASSGVFWTVTRAAGSWITDGFNPGNIARITAGTGLNVANLNNNMLLITVTDLVLTVKVMSSTSFVAGTGTSCAISVQGKETWIPTTGHTDESYTIEQWYSDIAQSEVFSGCKLSSVKVSVPTTGMVSADFTFAGKDLASHGTTQYFTSPTAASTSSVFTSVQGALIVNGVAGACVTSADFTINRATQDSTCIGGNSLSNIFTGKITASGSLNAYFADSSLRDIFDTASTVTLILAVATSDAKNADAMVFCFPKVKFDSSSVPDAELGLTQQVAFTALLNDNTTSNGMLNTTVFMQDTSI